MENLYAEYYQRALSIATDLETELKQLQRWEKQPLPDERFENMGAFGSNTMTFEQWLQFILLPTLHEIVTQGGNFPEDSQLASYAVRVWDGDMQTQRLQQLLQQLDDLIRIIPPFEQWEESQTTEHNDTTSLGGTSLPAVVFELVEILPGCEDQILEDQLQNYDIFLSYLSPKVRPQLAEMLMIAATKCTNENSRLRIQQAAQSIQAGGPAAVAPR